ncbi:hypothetical protein [Mycobacterium uberis]|uniref:hypothetical protein n=1 Tax=Mycobacterium uberis TaxID=2162698 RepID=UPI00140258B2|nr:hypothetical protein [Mycobacterium uberis]
MGLREVIADVAGHVDKGEIAVGIPPLVVDPLKVVVVLAGDDTCSVNSSILLPHGVVATAGRNASVLVALNDRIANHVFGSWYAIGIKHDQRLPDSQQPAGIDCVVGADADTSLLEEDGRPAR